MMRFAVVLIAGCFLGAGASAGQERAKLNVLLIVGDDLNTSMACYGHPIVKTPNLDRLAKAGVRFDRAYCQYPLCNPSRSSFLSGVRPGGSLKDRVWLPDHFQKHGYFTAEIGKVAHGFGSSTAAKWDLKDHSPKPSPAPSGTEGAKAGNVCRRVVEVLEEKRDKPFFMGVGFGETHAGVSFPAAFVKMYPPDQMTWPDEPPEHLKDIPEIAHDKNHYEDKVDEAERRRRVAVYLGSISYVDAQVGIILDALERLKLRGRTVVVLTGDHGRLVGEHGGFYGKMSLYEQATRVPLLVNAPGRKTGAVSPRVVELVDLFPTLAELCGLPRPQPADGTSFVPLLDEPEQAWKKAAFTVTERAGGWGRSVRTERYRYCEWPDGKAQLFDHEKDPVECRNLSGDPASAGVLAEMRRLLKEGMPTGSKRANPAPDPDDK